jgi:uncharacterized protein (DUF1778 family)
MPGIRCVRPAGAFYAFADVTGTGLDAESFFAFNDLLDAPLVGNPGLERLMAIRPPWVEEA